MHTFLNFVFDLENLKENLREPWMLQYDFTYIDNTIISGIEKNKPAILDILRLVERKATGKAHSLASHSASQLLRDDKSENGNTRADSQSRLSTSHANLN